MTTIETNPATFQPGATVTLTVTLRGSGSNAGIYLTTTKGTFTLVGGQNTKLVNGDVVHSSPKGTQGGQATFQVQWTAPSAPGATEFGAYTVLGNADGRSGGDTASESVKQYVFGCAGTTYFRDFDGDGVGSRANGTTLDCSLPQGYAQREGDCDDFDATILPGGTERCNAKDDNCDGNKDEGLSNSPTWPDADGDGFGARGGTMATGCTASGRAPNDRDCDDRDPKIRPMAMEVCNQRDDNCDGRVDENVRVRCGVGWCEALGLTCDPQSCQPGRPLTERCNFLDDDCDGEVDEGTLCAAGQACVRGACVVTEVDSNPVDGGETGPASDGGASIRPRPNPESGTCQAVPGLMWSIPLVLGAKRRRRVV
jgi:hypothetical protein